MKAGRIAGALAAFCVGIPAGAIFGVLGVSAAQVFGAADAESVRIVLGLRNQDCSDAHGFACVPEYERDFPAGHTVGDAEVRWVSMPEGYVARDTVLDPDFEAVTATPVFAGEMVRAGRLR